MNGSRRVTFTARAAMAIVLALALGDAVAAAQALPELQTGARVRIRASNIVDGQLTGKIASRTSDAVVVAGEHGEEYTIPFGALSEVNVSRGVSHGRGAIKGAMWGGGLGLGVGLMFAAVPNSERKSQSGFGLGPPTVAEGIMLATGGGIAIGAALGAISGSEQWERLHLPASITVVPVPRGIGLRFAVGR